MKKRIKRHSSIFLFLALSVPVFCLAANEKNGYQEGKRIKKINKSYDNVTPDTKLQIENSFGNVTVSTWDQNKITVDIEIGATASTDERAQEIMDQIDVKDSRDGNVIEFKTKVGEIHNGGNKRHKSGDDNSRSFYIDYVVHMPSANRLQIENSFGKTLVPDMVGLVMLTSKFGSLSTGKLTNNEAIDVEFGRAEIAEVSNGKVAFKFNKESRIGRVNGNVRISSEFSHNVQFNVGDNIKELSVFESYSGVRVIVTKSLSAEFDIHTSFGSFHNDSDFSIKEQKDDSEYGPHFDRDYSGKAGEGKARIRIKSSFGTVRLSHTAGTGSSNKDGDNDEDSKGKKKNKSDKSADESVEES